jgi:hypothetical protein
MDNLFISDAIFEKIQTKHLVSRSEIIQCFINRSGKLLFDNREKHKTKPPTLWFIAKTNKNRLLEYVKKLCVSSPGTVLSCLLFKKPVRRRHSSPSEAYRES